MPARFETPADFASNAHLPTMQLAARYGVHPRTIRKLRARLGIETPRAAIYGRKQRTAPHDFAEVAAAGMGFNALTRRFKVGHNTLRRWLLDAGIERALRDYSAPEWFAADAPSMSIKEACHRGSVCHETLYKWEAATGVKCRRGVVPKPKIKKARKAAQPKPIAPKSPKPAPEPFARVKPKRARPYLTKATRQPINSTNHDTSTVGRAAAFLARDCPVYRCNDEGRQSPGGRFWRVGNARLSDDDVIARAERKGWVADAWARIAA